MKKVLTYLLLIHIFGFTKVKTALDLYSQYEQNMNEAIRSARNIQTAEFLNNITRETKHVISTLEIFPRNKMDHLKYYRESQKGTKIYFWFFYDNVPIFSTGTI